MKIFWLSFFLIHFVCMSFIEKEGTCYPSVKQLRKLGDSKVSEDSTHVCPTVRDCYNCTAYFEDDVNCEWRGGSCQANFKFEYQSHWWKFFDPCIESRSQREITQHFCGYQGKNIASPDENFTMKSVNGVYGAKNLYCNWEFVHSDPNEILTFQFKARNLAKIIFSIEAQYLDGRRLVHRITRSDFVWVSEGLTSYTFHFYTAAAHDKAPFRMKISDKINDEDASSYIGLIISISMVFIVCLIFTLVFYRCSRLLQRRQADRNAERNRRLQILIRNGIRVQDVDHFNIDREEESLKNKNKETLEKMLATELNPIAYCDELNQYHSTCTICIESFAAGQKVIIVECKHIFHENCLRDYLFKNLLNPKCPNCNYHIIDKNSSEPVPHQSQIGPRNVVEVDNLRS